MFRFDRFEELRTSKGITKKFVSDTIGRSSQTIQDWKNGKSEPNDVQIAIVSKLLGTSPEYLRGEVDLHGLTDIDWRTMGAVYQGERTMRGKSLESAADGTVLTVDDLRDFEDNGTPLTLGQLNVACSGIGMSTPSVFQPWADKLYGIKKAPTDTDGRDYGELELAAHEYEGKITAEDKKTLIRMMRAFAASVEDGGANGNINEAL